MQNLDTRGVVDHRRDPTNVVELRGHSLLSGLEDQRHSDPLCHKGVDVMLQN